MWDLASRLSAVFPPALIISHFEAAARFAVVSLFASDGAFCLSGALIICRTNTLKKQSRSSRGS